MNVIADHVTFAVACSILPSSAVEARIVGHVDDCSGVEALVVALDASTNRPDGLVWLITWSLADGRAPRESNDVIALGSG